MYEPQSRYSVPFYVTRGRVLTWRELEHVGFDPAPFDLEGFSGSSQYRLPIICSTIAAIYRKSRTTDLRSRYIYRKMEGFAISGFVF